MKAANIDSNLANNWAMALHLSTFAAYLVPIAGILAPILIWQMKKDEIPNLDAPGKIVVNWLISAIIYIAISLLLILVFIGIPMLLVMSVLMIVFPIIGGLKAGNGELWPYPMSIRFFK